jgi:hypothetical protein
LSTVTQYAPSFTAAVPAAGAENEVIHGTLLPSWKSKALSRLPPTGAASAGGAATAELLSDGTADGGWITHELVSRPSAPPTMPIVFLTGNQ